MMKKFSNLLLAAVLGSGITIGSYSLLDKDSETLKIEHVDATPVMGAVYTKNEKGDIVPLSFTDAAESVMPSVVHIKSTQTMTASSNRPNQSLPDPFRDFFGDEFFRFFSPDQRAPQQGPQPRRSPEARVGSGSGVIINENGYIVTNNHVIANADDIDVTLYDNRTYKATVIGTDPTTDLALIQIKENNLPALPMVNSDDVKVGEWVMAVGNPFNLNSTVTAGIVSAKARSINILQEKYAIESFIQTDAAINPGNSGGALVNLNGGLIGINTAIASPTGAYAGYGFAVPANIVNKVVEDLLKYGTVQRGVLGVSIADVTSELADENDLDVVEGVYVAEVVENSGAEQAGVEAGDVIQKVDGQTVKNRSQLMAIIASHRPGDVVSVTIDRKGKIRELDVTLKNINGEEKLVAKTESEVLKALGADFKTIDKELARELKIDGGVEVAQLYPGKLRRSTDMKEGFIITKIDGKAVDSVEDLTRTLQNKKEGEGVMLEGVYKDYPGVYYYAFGK
ncbi:MAG: Do family serine endopeptidase [Candidatus Cyclobacteriaceae bacterium M3_2C_046]